ncbi:hypothetical protein Pla163_11890 [Planctomycetes bacterium Pla163]|uniref:Uncharacterized protein n=1 Tax=Rohdeia mirabilis TaxID=2528008 RepID=A0A518CY06_9BACT|nr:hypothetical protein Pla163_11890 [Planctomycetes bacterium Pla163]
MLSRTRTWALLVGVGATLVLLVWLVRGGGVTGEPVRPDAPLSSQAADTSTDNRADLATERLEADDTREILEVRKASVFRGRLVGLTWPGVDNPVPDARARVSLFHVRSTPNEAIFATDVRTDADGWFEVPLPFDEVDVEYPVENHRRLYVHVASSDSGVRIYAGERDGHALWRGDGTLVADPIRFEPEELLFTISVVDGEGEPFTDAWLNVESEIDWWRVGRRARVRAQSLQDATPPRPGVFAVYGESNVPLTYRVVAGGEIDGARSSSSASLAGLEPDGGSHTIVVPRRLGRVRFELAWSLPGDEWVVPLLRTLDVDKRLNDELEIAALIVITRTDLLELVQPVLAPAGAGRTDAGGERWQAPAWSEAYHDLEFLRDGARRVVEIDVPPGVWDLRATSHGRPLQCDPLRDALVVEPGGEYDLGEIDLADHLFLFTALLAWSLEDDAETRGFDGAAKLSRLERVRVDGSRSHALLIDVGTHPIWYSGQRNHARPGAARGPWYSPRGSGRATVELEPLKDDDGGGGGWRGISLHPVMASSEFGPWLHAPSARSPVDWLDVRDIQDGLGYLDDLGVIAALLGDRQLLDDWQEFFEEGFDLGLYDRLGIQADDLIDPDTWERTGHVALLVSAHPNPSVLIGIPGRATWQQTLRHDELNVVAPPVASASGLVVRFPEARDGWRFGVRLLDWRGDPWAVAPSAIALAAGERELSLAFDAEGAVRFVPCAWRTGGDDLGEACTGWVEAPTRREDLPNPKHEYWPPWVPPLGSGVAADLGAHVSEVALRRGTWQTVEASASLEDLHAAFERVRLSPPLPRRESSEQAR